MQILVYGWYRAGNAGDELFANAFRVLFPEHEFSFVSQITEENLSNVRAVFFGGGSFLSGDINVSPAAKKILKTKKIFYIGVGAETTISSGHLELMSLAKLIAIRSPEQLEKIKAINENTITIPDLVYSLQDNVTLSPKLKKSVLILPNIEVVPNHTHAHWKHSSWAYFKSEFAQFLDELVAQGFNLNFFSMCENKVMSDSWAASEIINMMSKRSTRYQLPFFETDILTLTTVLSQYEVIITQRFHGIILSEMMGTPYISLHHHDKLKFASPMNGISLPYYGIMKQNLLDSFNKLKASQSLPIESDIFETLKKKVTNILSSG